MYSKIQKALRVFKVFDADKYKVGGDKLIEMADFFNVSPYYITKQRSEYRNKEIKKPSPFNSLYGHTNPNDILYAYHNTVLAVEEAVAKHQEKQDCTTTLHGSKDEIIKALQEMEGDIESVEVLIR